MKINLPNVFYIIIAGSIIGLITNFIKPDGLPLIRETKKLIWADSINIKVKISADAIKNNLPKNKSLIKEKDTTNRNKINITLKDKKENTKNKEKINLPLFKEPIAINLKQAYTLFKENITFLDARENEAYKAGHIKGAFSLPYYDFDSYKNVLKKIPKNNVIVTYCAGTDCDLSILLGKQLFESGYKRVYIFFDGWNEWIKAKYPVEQ